MENPDTNIGLFEVKTKIIEQTIDIKSSDQGKLARFQVRL